MTAAGSVLIALALTVVSVSFSHGQSRPAHFADAGNSVLVARGAQVYAQRCGYCHGRRLQGQPLWQLQDRFAGRRAPAHDATGHTWQHSDDELYSMTKFGRFPSTPAIRLTNMPPFARLLSDGDILSVLAYIKSRWPLGLRASQAMLNPGFAGMPKDAAKVKWTLPPNCFESIEVWRAGSK